GGEILGHFLFGGDWDLVRVVHIADVAWLETDVVERAPVQRDTYVGVAHRDAQLLRLDFSQTFDRSGVQLARPVELAVGPLPGLAARACEQPDPLGPRRPRIASGLHHLGHTGAPFILDTHVCLPIYLTDRYVILFLSWSAWLSQ